MAKGNALKEKMREAVTSVMPIMIIVAVLCLVLVPLNTGLLLAFMVGALMIIIGMGLFTLGSDLSMTQMGNHMGAKLTQSRKLGLILSVSLLLGIAITVAEPDLQVLASNVPGIDKVVLIITVSVGVGIFLMVSMLRTIFSIPLKWLLLGFYGLIFLLAAFADPSFLAVAFDSGGVTTGPITVPFIMALGVGVATIRSDARAKEESFGLVALCSIGPILAVLLLGFVYKDSASSTATIVVNEYASTRALGWAYLDALPEYCYEIALALLPILIFFMIFQVFSLKLRRFPLRKIMVGLIMTYIGLVLFLTGVNVGFSSLGYMLGETLGASPWKYWLIPLAALMGWFIIKAEPAVHVLNKQVNDLSAGAISAKTMGLSLNIAIAAAMALAMLRTLTGISILWFMIPGYAIALALAFWVPPTFTAIAFDSGGVASGPLTATFMLPFAIGVCNSVGGNIMTDAFGLVAMVAMMPLITVQIMGGVYMVKSRRAQPIEDLSSQYGEDDVIDLWEVT